MKTLIKITTLAIFIGSIISCNTMQKEEKSGTDIVTDPMITNAVQRELGNYPEVPEKNIEVSTIKNIVTLKGSVNNIFAREKAAEIASIVRGVHGVINELDVKTVQISDETLAENIKDLFYNDPIIEAFEIDVTVDSGIVALSGIVDSWGEKILAEDVAKYVSGVRSVKNNINIKFKGKRSNHEVKADIAGLMQYDIFVDYDKIDAKVNDGVVILSGKVGSLFQKSKAISLAWVVGVDSVNADNLLVDSNIDKFIQKKEVKDEKSDVVLRNAINKTLFYDARIDEEKIEAEVSNGNVTLIGTVSNLRAKRAAGTDARNVYGVLSLNNNLKVVPLAKGINKSVIDNTNIALNRNPYFKNYHVHVKENDGTIIISGTVKYNFEKKLAEDLISGINGIKDIKNNLTVTNPGILEGEYVENQPKLIIPDLPPDDTIKKQVESELWWSPFVKQDDIKVKVDNGVVILSGTVFSHYEKDMAEKNAIEGGAFTVENNIIVDIQL